MYYAKLKDVYVESFENDSTTKKSNAKSLFVCSAKDDQTASNIANLLNMMSVPEKPVHRMKHLRNTTEMFHTWLYDAYSSIINDVKTRRLSMNELVDIGYFFREIMNVLDECRKDAKARMELASKLFALLWAEKGLTSPDMPNSINGTYARATPTIKQHPKLPAKGTPEYEKVLDMFYVPRRAISDGILKIDWAAASDFITRMAEEGKKLPDGLGETYTEYGAVYCKRNNITDNAE